MFDSVKSELAKQLEHLAQAQQENLEKDEETKTSVFLHENKYWEHDEEQTVKVKATEEE